MDTATVCVDVTQPNHPPVAVDDNTTSNGGAVTICTLTNDTDLDGDVLSLCGFTQPSAGGTVTQEGNCLVFTPNANVSGEICFTYNVCDADGAMDTATVCVDVTTDCDPIIEELCTGEMEPLVICPDFCLLSGTIIISNVESMYNCSIQIIDGENCIRYTPLPQFIGSEVLSITACNSLGDCQTIQYNVTVGDCDDNHPPVAQDDTYTIDCSPTALNLLANDTDIDGDILTICSNPTVTSGTIELTASGWVYTPSQGFVGEVQFTYTICDGHGGTDMATVTITVNCPTNCTAQDIYTCATPMQPQIICVEFCNPDLSIVSIVADYSCGITILDNYCFRYTALPLSSGLIELVISGCDSNGNCESLSAFIDIQSDCDNGQESLINNQLELQEKDCEINLPQSVFPGSQSLMSKFNFSSLEECYYDHLASFSVYATNGQLIYNYNDKIQNLEFQVNANLDQFDAGIFIYQIVIDGDNTNAFGGYIRVSK